MNKNNKIILDKFKKIDLKMNSNITTKDYLYNREKIRKSTNISNGFNKFFLIYPSEMTIIDVGQDEYAIKENDEILVTYGIIACCGIVIKNDNGIVLMHVSATIKPNDIIELLDDLKLGYNSEILLVLGALCNDFDYNILKLNLESRGNQCSCYRLAGNFGSIAIEQENIKICSEFDNENIDLENDRHKL